VEVEAEAEGCSLLEVVVVASFSALFDGIKEVILVKSLVVNGGSLRVVDNCREVVAVRSKEVSDELSSCRRARRVAAGTATTE
jgi:hypothetical protein